VSIWVACAISTKVARFVAWLAENLFAAAYGFSRLSRSPPQCSRAPSPGRGTGGRMVSVEEIADPKNDYNLNLPRYIDSTEREDLQDIDG
jgi:hypothetical protein